MRAPRLLPCLTLTLTLVLILIGETEAAHAAGAGPLTWASVAPVPGDFSATVLNALFPIGGGDPGGLGSEASVIGLIAGQITGFIGAIAAAWITYATLMNIHHGAETSRILGSNQTSISVARIGFAAVMMLPISNGFGVGQMMVMQAASLGAGMADAVYTNAIQAIGPDAEVLATPVIPGTAKIVANLINDELCMNLVDLASGTMLNEKTNTLYPSTQWLIQPPAGNTVNNPPGGLVGPVAGPQLTYWYSQSAGNGSGNPTCGSVTVEEASPAAATLAGASTDLAGEQQAALNSVLTGTIRAQVQSAAQNFWLSKNISALAPLQTIYTNAVATYTQQLTTMATTTAAAINRGVSGQASQLRNGSTDLLKSEVQQNTLGWTGAGAYYLEIAQDQSATLSFINNTPVVTTPTYNGLSPSLSADLAPLVQSSQDFMNTLFTEEETNDGSTPPSGIPKTLPDAKQDPDAQGLLTRLVDSMHISNGVLSGITGFLLPTKQIWTDPFGGLMALGQMLIHTALVGYGAAAVLQSTPLAAGSALFNFFTLNWGASVAAIAGHAVINFLAAPIFIALLGLLLPGLIIAYLLPMIPWVMWMAGVTGWIILVCEAMIAVPLWMLAHMTLSGDGFHGRATEGWQLLFSVVFRPVMMLIGLFLGYFVFDCMSWLIRQTFGIATGFLLQNGWVVSNLIGIGVLLTIFVMTHVVAALMSFRMVALLPHHIPTWLGFRPGNRVDMDAYQNQAAWGVGGAVAGMTQKGIGTNLKPSGHGQNQLPATGSRLISGPAGGSVAAEPEGMDTTLRATTDSSIAGEDRTDV